MPHVSAEPETAFIGRSESMREVFARLERAAASAAPVFVTGESGSGKELCARALHEKGPRASGPFVAVNCAAIPAELAESEFFGHVKGAFTGASEARMGHAEAAHGGTLFLDEICEMDIALQGKLLRFLETGLVRPVGGSAERRVDVRIICATNRDPQREVREGRFRADLFWRLHVLPVSLPPLRERGEDILLLARHFLSRFAEEEGRRPMRIGADAERLMLSHSWPGNVRQLQNVLRQIVVFHDAPELTADMLAPLLPPEYDTPPRPQAGTIRRACGFWNGRPSRKPSPPATARCREPRGCWVWLPPPSTASGRPGRLRGAEPPAAGKRRVSAYGLSLQALPAGA